MMFEGGNGGVTVQVHPHDARIMVREQPFTDVATHEELVRVTDEEVFEHARRFEQIVGEAARAYVDDANVHSAAITHIIDGLIEDVRAPLLEGASAADVVERYAQLRQYAERAIRSLRIAEAGADHHLNRVSDPYSALMEVYTKLPTLRPVLKLRAER